MSKKSEQITIGEEQGLLAPETVEAKQTVCATL